MGATSNTSTLLSSSASTSRHNHPQRQRRSGTGTANTSAGSNNNRYAGISSVRKICTPNLKNNRHHVAIATQVLSTKAFSQQGSINRRKFRHFGAGRADSDDEECFIRSKRRALLEKLFCYGISITVILLVMTGVVLAVGYMQSEKQRILSRSVKLAQEQKSSRSSNTNSNTITTQEPPPIVLARTTERPPTSTMAMNISKDETDDDDDIDELQILEPPAEILQEIMEHRSINDDNDLKEILEARNSLRKGKLLDLDEIEKELESKHRLPSEVKVLPPDGFTFDGYSFEFPIVRPPTNSNKRNLTEEEKTKNNLLKNLISIDPIENNDEETYNTPPASVVNANKDFSLSGFNFSIDNDNNKFSFRNFTDFGTLSNSDDSGNVDIPVVAKLQTDLFRDEEDSEDDKDSQSSASNKNSGRSPQQIPTPTEHDNSYTPRPSSVVSYPDKPPRISSKSKSPSRSGNHQKHLQENGKLHSYNALSSPNAETTTTFSNIEVSTSSPLRIEKFEFKTPVPGISDFKFDFTTPSPEVSGYLGLAKPQEFKLNSPTTSSNSNKPPPSIVNAYDDIDYSVFLIPSSSSSPASTGATTTTDFTATTQQDNQFSKRSYPGFDNFDSSSSSSDINPFAHLLTQSPTSYIGSASPTGATLNFQQPTYNFDTQFDSSFNTPQLNIPSGIIPLDLAASYIQVGNPPPLKNNHGGDSFNYNPSSALTSLIQNSGNGGGEQPNYNTIGQGIHLLSLLSGNIPQHLLNNQDQFQSGSQINQQYAAKPEYQIAALTGYGGSSNAFLSGLNTNQGGGGGGQEYLQHAESRSLPSYSADLHPSKSFSSGNSGNDDQLPSESSFSQIISKISDNDARNLQIGGGDAKSQAAVHLPAPPTSPTITAALANQHQPKSLSIDIISRPRNSLREIEKSLLDSFPGISEKNENALKTIAAESTSRKKDSVIVDSPIVDFLRSDLETAGSDMHSHTKKLHEKDYKSLLAKSFKNLDSPHTRPQPFGRKLVIKTIKIKEQKNIKDQGLKSGFYF